MTSRRDELRRVDARVVALRRACRGAGGHVDAVDLAREVRALEAEEGGGAVRGEVEARHEAAEVGLLLRDHLPLRVERHDVHLLHAVDVDRERDDVLGLPGRGLGARVRRDVEVLHVVVEASSTGVTLPRREVERDERGDSRPESVSTATTCRPA